MPKEKKSHHQLFRLSPTERRMLDTLSKASGLTISALLRQAIRAEHRRAKAAGLFREIPKAER